MRVMLVALLVVGCSSRSDKKKPAPVPAKQQAAAVFDAAVSFDAATKTAAVRDDVFYLTGRALWRMKSDGTGAQKIARTDGMIGDALISPNLAYAALVRGADLYVYEFDRGFETRITHYDGGDDGDISASIRGWSPDGRRLVYTVDQEYRGELNEPPDGVGTFVLDALTKESSQHKYASEFVAFTDDSLGFYLQTKGSSRKQVGLATTQLVDADSVHQLTELPTTTGFPGHMQIAGGSVAYLDGPNLRFVSLSGNGKPVVLEGNYQRSWKDPRLSPDGQHLAAVLVPAGHAPPPDGYPVGVIDLGAAGSEPRTVASFASKLGTFRWYDDSRLLLSDPLRLVDVHSGRVVPLNDNGSVVQLGVP